MTSNISGSATWVRPYGLIQSGNLRLGYEVKLQLQSKGPSFDWYEVLEIRPHTGIPDPMILSVGLVNAHSHLEYRGMQNAIDEPEYLTWIMELTRRKQLESPEQVSRAIQLAVEENLNAGVAWVGEHSDRPGSAEFLSRAGIGGHLFQEYLDYFSMSPREVREMVNERHLANQNYDLPVTLAPHAAHTVHGESLEEIGKLNQPTSIHFCETEMEDEYFAGTGRIFESRSDRDLLPDPRLKRGLRTIDVLEESDLLRPGVQLVHSCHLQIADVRRIARSGATVVHCPRSNRRLKSPRAPIRELLDAGVCVGLGCDSPASSGPIDLFDEMRTAIEISAERGKLIHAHEVWNMATTMGYASFGDASLNKKSPQEWDLRVGNVVPILAIEANGARTLDDLIHQSSPDDLSWFRI